MTTNDNVRTRRLTVLFTAAEYEELRRRAGIATVSAWVRNTVLSGDVLPVGEWKEAKPVLGPPKFLEAEVDRARERRAAKECKHGWGIGQCRINGCEHKGELPR